MKITALAIPKLLVIVAPIAFLIASLHTLIASPEIAS